MNSENLIYIDGNYFSKDDAKISVYDHGLLYGDGVFEGIRAYNRKILRLKEHIGRIFCSADAIQLEIPVSEDELSQIVIDTFKGNNITDGYARLVVTRGKGDLGIDPLKCEKATIFCIVDSIVLYPKEMHEKGIPIITASQRRNNAACLDPQIKSLNYLNNILAKIEANRVGVSEALMLNENGLVAECAGDNIFMVKNKIVYTPPVNVGLLVGITRNLIIELAKKNNITVVEKEFTLPNLYSADECFLTGTAAEVIPVTSIDSRTIGNGLPGPITKKLLELFREFVQKNGTPIPS